MASKNTTDFVFAAKVPQAFTHEKVLVDCDAEFGEFMETMNILGEKLGPLVFQFPHFDRCKFSKQEDFLTVLKPFLKKLPANHKFAIEIRNKTWLEAHLTDLLREHKIALVLQDLHPQRSGPPCIADAESLRIYAFRPMRQPSSA